MVWIRDYIVVGSSYGNLVVYCARLRMILFVSIRFGGYGVTSISQYSAGKLLIGTSCDGLYMLDMCVV